MLEWPHGTTTVSSNLFQNISLHVDYFAQHNNKQSFREYNYTEADDRLIHYQASAEIRIMIYTAVNTRY